ncbi:MAG: site-specific integrase [Myxococcota bacterium]
MSDEISPKDEDGFPRVWASNTKRAYKADWNDFEAWCAAEDCDALPAKANDVGAYLLHLHRDGLEASTIRRKSVAIGRMHVASGYDNPTEHRSVESVARGVFVDQHYEPSRKARVDEDKVFRLVDAIDHDIEAQTRRDRAVILLGWRTRFRRGELASLTVADLSWMGSEGLAIQLRRDVNRYQQKDPDLRILSRARDAKWCALAALERWMALGNIDGGPLFRRIDRWGNIWPDGLTGKSLTNIVKNAAEQAGLDPADYSFQSFRPVEDE